LNISAKFSIDPYNFELYRFKDAAFFLRHSSEQKRQVDDRWQKTTVTVC